MSEALTNGEIARQLADLKAQVATGFAGTHGRLDKVNGQLDAHREKLSQHTTTLAEHRVKLSTLNRHTFPPRSGDGGEDTPIESLPITRRDLWVAVGTIGAVLAAVKWLPALLSAGQVAP